MEVCVRVCVFCDGELHFLRFITYICGYKFFILNQGLRFYEICDFKICLIKMYLHIPFMMYYTWLILWKNAEWPI
jgi:hypothetical protein